jgi:hypothetical protein
VGGDHLDDESLETMKGGARKGPGRPAGKIRVMTNFSLNPATVAQLKRVKRGQRSKFVEAAIVAALSADAK